VIILVNVITLAIVVVNVVLPYWHQIVRFIREQKNNKQYATSDTYCTYFQEYPFPTSLKWYFDKWDRNDPEELKWITFSSVFWYDPWEYIDEPPLMSKYVFGVFPKEPINAANVDDIDSYDENGNYIGGWPLDLNATDSGFEFVGQMISSLDNSTLVNVVYPTMQHFFAYDSSQQTVDQICMYLNAENGSPFYFEYAVPENESTASTRCIIGTEDYQYLYQNWGYDRETQLLFEEVSIARYMLMEEFNIIDFKAGQMVNVMAGEYYADEPVNDANLVWSKTQEVNFFDKKSNLCLGASKKMKRANLVSELLASTGYNINVILTLNYFIALLLFRKKQPVKSRLPLLTLNAMAMFVASFFVVLVQITINGLAVSGFSELNKGGKKQKKVLGPLNKLYLITMSVQEILAAFCMLIYSLHIARYYYLKYLYSIMSKRETVGPKDFVIHRRLTSNIAFAIYSTIIFLVILIVFVPLIATNYTISYDSTQVMVVSILVYCIRTFVMILVATCFTIDLVVNFKNIVSRGLGGLSWFFGHSDPLYFRVEMLLFAVIWFLIHPSFGLTMRSYYLQNNAFVVDPYSPFFSRAKIASEILYQIYSNFYLTFLICGGAICLIQLFVMWKTRSSTYKPLDSESGPAIDNDDESDLNMLLQSKDGFKVMKDFCALEWSTENILCWQALYDYKTTLPQTAEKIKAIMNMYIRKGSNMEVNIPGKTRAALTASVGIDGEKATDDMGFEMFHDLLRQIETNLCDTLSRLVHTDEYAKFLQKKDVMKGALDLYL